MTIVEFLRARIEEDRVHADAATCDDHGLFSAARARLEADAKEAILMKWASVKPPGDLGLGAAVRDLAAVYSGHADYREEWLP